MAAVRSGFSRRSCETIWLLSPNKPAEARSSTPVEVYVVLAAVTATVMLARSMVPGTYWEQMALARSLVAGRGFADPFPFPTGYTAAYAPVHPLLLAGILGVFGDHPSTAIPIILAEVLIHVANVVLLARISVAIFSSWVPGCIAAAGVLLFTQPLPQWENGMAQLAAEIFFLISLRRGVLAAGAASGMGWLISPALILFSIPSAFFLRGQPMRLESQQSRLSWSHRGPSEIRLHFTHRCSCGTTLGWSYSFPTTT